MNSILDDPSDHDRGLNVHASDEFTITMWVQGQKVGFPALIPVQYDIS